MDYADIKGTDLTYRQTERLLEDHGFAIEDYTQDYGVHATYYADDVLAWLGY